MLRKRNSIDSLGHAVVLHLKRFEMNYDTGQTAKLNNRFEFPEELDLWPVSYECLAQQQQQQQPAGAASPPSTPRPRDYYLYDLVGVVVHTGTLESGHYYSFIKERGPRAALRAAARPGGRESGGRWLEFNDSVVSEFDSSRIPAECFGGVQTVSQWNAALKMHIEVELPVVKSAYMLVYERRTPQPIEVPLQLVPHLAPSRAGGRIERDHEMTKRARTDASSPAVSVEASAEAPGIGAVATTRVLPHELVPTDPATGRGLLPASIVHDVLADNASFARQCQQVDSDLAALWHLIVDAVARHPRLLQRGLSLQALAWPSRPRRRSVASAPVAAPTPVTAALSLSLSAASFTAPPFWLPDISVGASDSAESKLDLHTFARAAALFCFYPLLKSTHVDQVREVSAALRLISPLMLAPPPRAVPQVPHFAHSLARLASLNPAVAAGLLTWTVSPLGSGLELLREAALRSPIPHARASFGRVLATAVLSRLLLPVGPDSEVSQFKMPAKKGAPVTEYADTTAVTSFIMDGVTKNFEFIATCWRNFDQFFGALYDMGRGGYGNGLPLVVWEVPPHPAAPSPPSPVKAGASAAACASTALAAWAEGRAMGAPSLLSPEWAVGSNVAPDAAAQPQDKLSIGLIKKLQKAAHRSR
jgi:hypothetical protein